MAQVLRVEHLRNATSLVTVAGDDWRQYTVTILTDLLGTPAGDVFLDAVAHSHHPLRTGRRKRGLGVAPETPEA